MKGENYGKGKAQSVFDTVFIVQSAIQCTLRQFCDW